MDWNHEKANSWQNINQLNKHKKINLKIYKYN